MSGLAVAFGDETDPLQIKKMLRTMKHRGKDLVGIYQNQTALFGQNYLRADIGNTDGKEVPVFLEGKENLRICYDGQISNWAELAHQHGVSDGPFREERLLLKLYLAYGTQMLDLLDQAVFVFVISDGKKLLAARDLLGIKTLFYGKKPGTFYLSSELKSLTNILSTPLEFPPGSYVTEAGNVTTYTSLTMAYPEAPTASQPEEMTVEIRQLVRQNLQRLVDFKLPTACLLSGGLDSSIIAYEADVLAREKGVSPLKTFSFGLKASEDISNARLVAEYLHTDHNELVVDLNEILEVLPAVIYYLESFDPSLVRSAVANYLISRYAREKGYHILLSGEGADEIFCGYSYLKNYPDQELYHQQIKCLGFLHNNTSLRLDRMNMCHSVKVLAPLVFNELISTAMHIPPEYKIKEVNGEKIEKWIFRKAYEDFLPTEIVWRKKQEFSQGSGSAGLLPECLAAKVNDLEYRAAKKNYPFLRSKEEWYYFRIFKEYFGDGAAVQTVGRWISI